MATHEATGMASTRWSRVRPGCSKACSSPYSQNTESAKFKTCMYILYTVAGNVCGEVNLAVCCFGGNSQTLHPQKFSTYQYKMIVCSKPKH